MDPRADVAVLAAGLDDRERDLVSSRLGAEHPLTLEELGHRFGVSRERIRQIESELREKLAHFPWVVVMAGVLPSDRQWISHAKLLGGSDAGRAWSDPLNGVGPTTLELLLAADQFETRPGGWLARGMSQRWDQLIDAGRSGHVTEEEYLAELRGLGLDSTWAGIWMSEHGLTVRHGIVRPVEEKLGPFLAAELAAHGGTSDLDTILGWVQGRWSQQSARNLLQTDEQFTRVDVKQYALATLGLPAYRGIRAAIEDLINECGPMPLDDVVETVCASFEVKAGSVRAYAEQSPFRITDGVVHLREPQSISSGRAGSAGLVDIPEGRRWRGIFKTPTGYAYRFTVTADHLRGSGWPVSLTIGRIVGVRSGRVWELPITGVEATLKVSRAHNDQPALGSVKKALDAEGAREGDLAFIRFDGREGGIHAVRITVSRPAASDPFSQALALVGCSEDAEDPFETICAAMGVEADYAAELVEVAAARKDDALASALAQIARM